MIEFLNAVYLVIPEYHPEHGIAISHQYVNSVSLYTESAALQLYIIPYIKSLHEFAQQGIAIHPLSASYLNYVFR